MLRDPRNTHWVIADEVLGPVIERKLFNFHKLAANHREGGEATRGVEGLSANMSRETSVALISLCQ